MSITITSRLASLCVALGVTLCAHTIAGAQSQPTRAFASLTVKVGERVEYVDNGKWYKAIITELRDDSANQLDGRLYTPYRVHPLGFNRYADAWVCCAAFSDPRSQLRAVGAGATEPVPGGEANDEVVRGMRPPVTTRPVTAGSGGGVPAKRYHCVFFAGNALVNAAPLTITGSGTYAGGTYHFDPARSTLLFHGGDFDGQRAEYESSGGRPLLHILGKSGRRVIDCD